jgi:hypothetical protein
MSIDIVYLWVNGNDPVWQGKRALAAKKLEVRGATTLAKFGNVEGRFRDNDELRYSLRALELYFPAHGHVFIVTDGQRPDWLSDHAGVTLIDHHSLIPESNLPTFDSSNIESYIHRIPRLSERYFYLNDDVFFGAPVDINHWFWEGGIYTAWSDDPLVSNEPLKVDDTSLENACRMSNEWLQAKANDYIPIFRTFAHSPRPMLKSLLFELEIEAPELFSKVRSSIFREWDKPTIVSDFVLRWALMQGIAKINNYLSIYVSTGEVDKTNQLETLLAARGKMDFFCINDTTDDALSHDARLIKVRNALRCMLPLPSRFEC